MRNYLQRRAHVARFVTNLSMGEAERREPGGKMGLISNPVAGLLGRGAVVAQPVGLDHKPQVRPEEVDPKAVYAPARKRGRQARSRDEWKEEPLQVRVGKAKGAPIQKLAQYGNPGPSRIYVEDDAQGTRVDQVKPVGLVDGTLEARRVETAREVNQGESRLRHRDALMAGDICGLQTLPAVNAYASTTTL
ncbi:MAG TPA: hypothetical protein VHU14_04115 [Solirubrobacterales bacterium]|nr:hypothetical protein [Solirubrobacterales bacterium]